MFRRLFVLTLALAALLFFPTTSSAATYFTGNLDGAQETPPTPSTATGFGRVTLNDAETQITVSVYYGSAAAPLTSNVTIGHIHRAAVGDSGPIIFDLMPTAGVTFGSVVNMTFAITPAQVADLKAGLYYFNIHTANFGAGEIRGQINVDAPFVAYMDNNQENPPTASSARGSGVVSINAAGTQALVSMNWTGLTGNATGGHVHAGRSRVNGGIVCDLMPPASPSGSVVDRLCNFSPAQITSLRQAQFYLNVHTIANSGGEIRGQIQRRRSTVLDFDGDSRTDYAIARQNTPALTTDWWILNSSGGVAAFPHGLNTDFSTTRIVACDFDNDGKDDPSIWRSAASPGAGFLILDSGSLTVRFEQFGTTGDDPRVVYDYDGDGRCDPAVFRSSDDTWYYLGSSNNPSRNITYVRWGTLFANPGDYDGDGRGDFVDQQGGNWWLLRSSDGTFQVITAGTASSFGTPGDYDGDGKTDIGLSVNETPNLVWYYYSSLNPTQNIYLTRRAWGPSTGTRVRAQGDYDGDGKSDYAVWVEGATASDPTGFWVLPMNTLNSPFFVGWGAFSAGTNDFPVAGYNNR
ncbi:MAG TPA: CHRD domain-containing protein [Pyrinomonadaceae bacterium]